MSLTTSYRTPAEPDLQQKRARLYQRWQNPWLMGLYFWRHLPTLAWWGVRVRAVDEDSASVSIPYGWRTQNPFRSTYFAALSGAAELSTGLLVLAATAGRGSLSTLIIENRATYRKKANARLTFTCAQAADIREAVARAIREDRPQTIEVETIGRLPDGTEAARMFFTWSILAKKPVV